MTEKSFVFRSRTIHVSVLGMSTPTKRGLSWESRIDWRRTAVRAILGAERWQRRRKRHRAQRFSHASKVLVRGFRMRERKNSFSMSNQYEWWDTNDFSCGKMKVPLWLIHSFFFCRFLFAFFFTQSSRSSVSDQSTQRVAPLDENKPLLKYCRYNYTLVTTTEVGICAVVYCIIDSILRVLFCFLLSSVLF